VRRLRNRRKETTLGDDPGSLIIRHNVKDVDGICVKDELTRHGFLGATPSSFQHIPLKAHFELHIEQGPILDINASPVGTVSGVQALRWFEIKLQGRGSHAGTTPMRYRMDPLAAFGKFAAAIEEIANDHGGLCTIGRINSDAPQSTNCILDNIVFHLDTRHHEDHKIDEMEKVLRAKLEAEAMSTITTTQTASMASTSAAAPTVLHLRGSQRPAVNGKRMNETLHHSCQWGCTSDGGMSESTWRDISCYAVPYPTRGFAS